jgi:hypothetical protein
MQVPKMERKISEGFINLADPLRTKWFELWLENSFCRKILD